MTNFASP
ncbi:hypothetical protein N499_0885A, partial [Wolbachia pipientis wVitA]